MNKKYLFLLLFVFYFVNLFLSSRVFAESNVILSPTKEVERTTGYYNVEIKPGDKKTFNFFITNKSNQEVETMIYPSDSIPSKNGGKNFRNPDEKNHLVGTWFENKQEKIVLKPNEIKQVDYVINIPKDIKPGQYIGLIALYESIEGSEQEAKENEASYKINIVNKYGIQMVLNYNIESSEHNMEIVDFKHTYLSDGTLELLYYLKNNGTILEKPSGNLIIYDQNNNEIINENYTADSVYSDTTVEMSFKPKKILNEGNYKAKVTSKYAMDTIEKEFQFTIKKEEVKKSIEKLSENNKIELPEEIKESMKNKNSDRNLIITVGSIIVLLLIIVLILFIVILRKKKK